MRYRSLFGPPHLFNEEMCAVHTSVLDTHVVVAVDKGRDGQLSIKLKHVEHDFLVGILALYLPPDNYIYGRDPENFFRSAILFQVCF